jgi:hypothetical protein
MLDDYIHALQLRAVLEQLAAGYSFEILCIRLGRVDVFVGCYSLHTATSGLMSAPTKLQNRNGDGAYLPA